mmetsp:Transcript_33937/g.25007  ORF Transcript_33937/g.25007 Transcript_33937/m.25007 type:complete len:160 (+) Transcript_33937:1146-1625(+)
MVLNVQNYADFHPAGRFLLEANAGRDISKFFHGGYSMENTGKVLVHSHSPIAKRIVNGLIVGKLEQPAAKFQGTVVEKTDVNGATAVFKFKVEGKQEGKGKGPQTFYSDIDMIGRHYLLNAVDNPRVKRHYTISNVMRKDVYEHVVAMLQGKLSGQPVQ